MAIRALNQNACTCGGEEDAAVNRQVFERCPVLETSTREHLLPHIILAGTFEGRVDGFGTAKFCFIDNIWVVSGRVV